MQSLLQKQSLALTRQMSTSSVPGAISHVTVIGAGLMGAGIVQVAAQANFKVTMVDVSPDALAKGQKIIQSSLARIAKKKFETDPSQGAAFVSKVLGNISTSTDPLQAAKSSDLVIEAIVEKLSVKQQLFKSLDAVAPAHTLFASNTSSLPITDIASATNRRDQFAGLHFFNPVPQMKLVEVISTKDMDPKVQTALVAFSIALGKVPVACKDTPGYVLLYIHRATPVLYWYSPTSQIHCQSTPGSLYARSPSARRAWGRYQRGR